MHNPKYYLKYRDKILKRDKEKRLNNRKKKKCRICNNPCLNYKYRVYCSEECQKEGIKKLGREHKRKQGLWFYEYKKKLGGCKICGYNKCIGCLDFHHKNNDKKVSPSALRNYNPKFAIKELKKCILLCKNCHYEIHYNTKIEENGDVYQ